MDLQPLFNTPILEQEYIDRDYSGFGNDVWIVRTTNEHVIVRVSASSGDGGAFWGGLTRLFGIDSTNMHWLSAINERVNDVGVFRAPRVLRTGTIAGRDCAVMELLPGAHIDSFDDLQPAQAEAFGRMLARAHERTYEECGGPAGRLTYPVAEFHQRAADVIDWLSAAYPLAGDHAAGMAAKCATDLRALAPPEAATLILIDSGGSQYLWADNGPTAVVDTEACAFAPAALELIQIEADNGERFAQAFRRGYESVTPLPDLVPVRDPYRCLLTLLEVNGDMPLDEALAVPAWL